MGTTGRKNKNKKKRTIRERQRDQYVLQLIDSWLEPRSLRARQWQAR